MADLCGESTPNSWLLSYTEWQFVPQFLASVELQNLYISISELCWFLLGSLCFDWLGATLLAVISLYLTVCEIDTIKHLDFDYQLLMYLCLVS